VAGRKAADPAPAARTRWSKLERVGASLWVGVAIMIIGLGTLYAMS